MRKTAALEPLETDAVISDAQPKVSRPFELLHIAIASEAVVGQMLKNVGGVLPVDAAEIVLGGVGPLKEIHKPNSRSTSS